MGGWVYTPPRDSVVLRSGLVAKPGWVRRRVVHQRLYHQLDAKRKGKGARNFVISDWPFIHGSERLVNVVQKNMPYFTRNRTTSGNNYSIQ